MSLSRPAYLWYVLSEFDCWFSFQDAFCWTLLNHTYQELCLSISSYSSSTPCSWHQSHDCCCCQHYGPWHWVLLIFGACKGLHLDRELPLRCSEKARKRCWHLKYLNSKLFCRNLWFKNEFNWSQLLFEKNTWNHSIWKPSVHHPHLSLGLQSFQQYHDDGDSWHFPQTHQASGSAAVINSQVMDGSGGSKMPRNKALLYPLLHSRTPSWSTNMSN